MFLFDDLSPSVASAVEGGLFLRSKLYFQPSGRILFYLIFLLRRDRAPLDRRTAPGIGTQTCSESERPPSRSEKRGWWSFPLINYGSNPCWILSARLKRIHRRYGSEHNEFRLHLFTTYGGRHAWDADNLLVRSNGAH